MVNIANIMKQAQAMQQKVSEMQEKLAQQEVEGKAGGNLVSVTLTGRGDMRKVNIDTSLLKPEEKEVLEDLIVAAHNDARNKVESMFNEKLGEATSGFALPPGMKLPF